VAAPADGPGRQPPLQLGVPELVNRPGLAQHASLFVRVREKAHQAQREAAA
jgi:hypothetical protein